MKKTTYKPQKGGFTLDEKKSLKPYGAPLKPNKTTKGGKVKK